MEELQRAARERQAAEQQRAAAASQPQQPPQGGISGGSDASPDKRKRKHAPIVWQRPAKRQAADSGASDSRSADSSERYAVSLCTLSMKHA
jgi:hypothetical protein